MNMFFREINLKEKLSDKEKYYYDKLQSIIDEKLVYPKSTEALF